MKVYLKRLLVIVLCLTLPVTVLFGCSDSSGSSGEDDGSGLTTINIALEAPLSGSGSWSGKAMSAGCNIALENMADQFAALGYKINLVVNDHQASSDVAATDITKDIELYHTPLVIGTYTGPLVTMSSVAEDNQVVILNPLAMGEQLVGLNDWLYNICPSYSVTCEAMARYLYNERGIRDVVLFGDSSSTSLAQREAFMKVWETLGGTVLSDVECETGTTDFLSVCAKNFAADFDYASYAVDVRAEVPQEVIDRYNEAYVVDGMEFNSLQYTIANFGNAIGVLYQSMEYCSENGLDVTGANLKTALDTIESFETYDGVFSFMEGNTVKTPIDIYQVVRGEAELAGSYFD